MGALLRLTNYTAGSPGASYYPAYDGNGNVTALVNATTGDLAVVYEYDPFGNLIRNDTLDAAVADNPFRFSTKYRDTETGLVYYGHRFYSPTMGRFINKDPIEEAGGLNLYGFCGNNGINGWDYLGNYQLTDSNWEGDTGFTGDPDPSWKVDGNDPGVWRGSDGHVYLRDYGPSGPPVGRKEISGGFDDPDDPLLSFGQMVGLQAMENDIAYENSWSNSIDGLNAEVADMMASNAAVSWDEIAAEKAAKKAAKDSGNLQPYIVTYHKGAGTTTGSVGGKTVSLSSGSGPGMILDQISNIYTVTPPSSAPTQVQAASGVDPNNPATTNTPATTGGDYQGMIVTYPNGNQAMPITTVKNQAQANRLGVPVGSIVPVIVPPGQDPQGMINQWTVLGLSDNSANFAITWKPGGPNDYKHSNPIYDAYGNFEYGATGIAAGFTGSQLQDAGQLLKFPGSNDPINVRDIQSGINTVSNGGVIITVPVHFP